MLPGSQSSARRTKAGLKLKEWLGILIAAAVLFLLTGVVLYSTMPEHSTSHLRSTVRIASGLATAAKSKVAAAKATVSSAKTSLVAAVKSKATAAASTAAEEAGLMLDVSMKGVERNSFQKLAQRGKSARARALAECKDLVQSCPTWAQSGEVC